MWPVTPSTSWGMSCARPKSDSTQTRRNPRLNQTGRTSSALYNEISEMSLWRDRIEIRQINEDDIHRAIMLLLGAAMTACSSGDHIQPADCVSASSGSRSDCSTNRDSPTNRHSCSLSCSHRPANCNPRTAFDNYPIRCRSSQKHRLQCSLDSEWLGSPRSLHTRRSDGFPCGDADSRWRTIHW